MSEIVIVAIIGVFGTLAGAVLAPFAKERLDRRSAERAATRRAVGEVILAINQTLTEMSRSDSARRAGLGGQLEQQTAQLELLLSPGEGAVTSMVGMAGTIAAVPGRTKLEQSLNPLMTSTATTMLARWYRGEIKAASMAQDWADMWSTTREALLDGSMMPGGDPLLASELSESELQELNAMKTRDTSS